MKLIKYLLVVMLLVILILQFNLNVKLTEQIERRDNGIKRLEESIVSNNEYIINLWNDFEECEGRLQNATRR